MNKQYTIKYVNIKTNKETYIYLKPRTLEEVKIFITKQTTDKDTIIKIIYYDEYLKHSTVKVDWRYFDNVANLINEYELLSCSDFYMHYNKDECNEHICCEFYYKGLFIEFTDKDYNTKMNKYGIELLQNIGVNID